MKHLVVLLVAACSSAPSASFGSAPITTATSSACGAGIAVYAPDPLTRGSSSIKFVATDLTTSAPKSGLVISIVPFMPAMGHGSATQPSVVDQGGGVYVASDVVMPMPGTWQLRTTIGGVCSDSLVIDVDVQ